MPPLGWTSIVRLGLVQAAIGAVVMLATSLLNRVMVVEYALPATIPAALVTWHYAVQMARPIWGHGSDRGRRRTPWIVGGMGVLALGALLAADAVTMMATRSAAGIALAILAFTMIGAGVGAAGTSLLALLAARTAPDRRAAAAAITWIMMIAGIAITAVIAGASLDPFTPARLVTVGSAIALAAFLMSLVAVRGIEGPGDPAPDEREADSGNLVAALRAIWSAPEARAFTYFVFCSMLAYSMQDLILEPFAGLVFGMTPGQSTSLSGVQNGGVLVGMVLVGVSGGVFRWIKPRAWIIGGCVGSAAALIGLACAARAGPGWPIHLNIGALGFANGVFAVAAIRSMMELAGADGGTHQGARMGIWGAAQAIAFGLGGLIGAAGVDIGRVIAGSTREAFLLVFTAEAALFLLAARLALAAAPASPALPKGSEAVA